MQLKRFNIAVGLLMGVIALILSGCGATPPAAPGGKIVVPPLETEISVSAPGETEESTSVPSEEEMIVVPEAGTVPADWQRFHDETYGFEFYYPADWTLKELELGGPGQPEDWPITRFVMFFPQSLNEALHPSAPPDPNMPTVVAPIHLEVCVGPEEQLRRAYPAPGATESFAARGVNGMLERDTFDDFNVYRYVFTHPADSNLRIVFSDSISGFSARVAETPEFAQLTPTIIATFAFVEQ